MANIGQAALIVVGTVVGAYFGNPQLGFALGALAGSELFPTQLPSGPKLTDNRTTTANVGDPIPIVFGTATIAGTVIWLAPYVQHSNKTGGKGGPSQTTYSYTQSIAIGLCEAVVDGGQAIHGMTRVWENGTIVYDIRPQQSADTATGQPAETDTQYANRLAASAAYAETFTLYLGDETQTADPTIEAIEGFGNVPGWRGRAYIVYPNRNLQTAQGWRHPNFTFEVFQAGIGSCINSTEFSNEVLYPWGSGTGDPTNSHNVNTYQIRQVDPACGPPPGYGDILYASIGDALGTVETYQGFASDIFLSYTATPYTDMANVQPFTALAGGATTDDYPESFSVQLYYTFINPTYGVIVPPSQGRMYYPGWNAFDVSPSGFATPNALWAQGYSTYKNTGFPSSGAPPSLDPHFLNMTSGGGYFTEFTYDAILTVMRRPSAPLDPCLGLPPAPITGYCIRGDGKYVKGGPWTKDTTNNYLVLQKFATTGANRTVTPLNPGMLFSSPDNNETFWTAAYNAAVSDGTIAAGMLYGADGGGGANHYPVLQDFGYTIDMSICTGSGAGVSIADVISALCSRAQLMTIDVSDLTGIFVDGYSISSVSNATNCIQPLRSIGFFDAVESAGILCFRARGKPIVATLTEDQIGAFDGGSGSTVPPSVTVARVDETTLPRSIRLHYKSVNRDYQDGEQPSPFRLTTKAINDQDISVPFCMGDTQALQCAEILWSDSWAAKNTYTVSIDQSLSEIEVGDAVGLPVDGVLQRARIISEQNSSAVLRKLSLVSDNEGAYISFAIAEAPQIQPQVLTLLAGTALELLDLPALQDADNDAGFYLAAERTASGNAWKGCVIYKSIDSGSTWASMFSMVVEATVGTLHATPAVSEFFTWDDTTQIVVDLASSAFSLESRTDDAVINGANAAAIGADGRWEIIQYANATQLSATQWQLSRLLRGRRGTEHNIGASLAGDSFVVLSTGDLARIVLSTSEIGALRDYDAPSIGATFSSGTIYPFAGHAQALKPFSPVDVVADLETDGDIRISWTRRDRLGRTLMSGVDMPLSEATLAFQVDIFDHTSPPETVLRTLSTSSTGALYTAAEQAADFGSSPALTRLRVAVYQMSAVVGRGTPAIEVLTIGASP